MTDVKVAPHWCATGATLEVLEPLAAVALGADPHLLYGMFAAALLGSLAFAFLGGIGAALALGARRGGLLIALLVLPLLAPPVIFGAAMVGADLANTPALPPTALAAAYALAAIAGAPFAMAAAIRNAIG